MTKTRCAILLLCAAAIVGLPTSAHAQYLRIRDICRIKGQEENTLHGLGLVVGLKGTGDSDEPTIRALARMLDLMGNAVDIQGAKGKLNLEGLKGAKNVAVVLITATVPPEGARQGEQLNCSVNAISAKSLEGGHLVVTPLVGPRPPSGGPQMEAPRVFALAQGPIVLTQTGPPTSGSVHRGCRLEEDFSYQFISPERSPTGEEYITLVIDRNHAGFPTAEAIQSALNGDGGNRRIVRKNDHADSNAETLWSHVAKAIDPVNVRVTIPEAYSDRRVDFVATVLDTQVAIPPHDARVVINERNGVVVVGDNVMVGRVAVTHKNISIQTGSDPALGPLFVVDPLDSASSSTTRLEALVRALNALKVSPNDIIDIIKALERSGDLYGRLVVE